MTILEYIKSHPRGETVTGMLDEITSAQAAKHEPYMGLPATKSELERALRVLKSQWLIIDVWPPGAVEGVWRAGMRDKVEPQRELFS